MKALFLVNFKKLFTNNSVLFNILGGSFYFTWKFFSVIVAWVKENFTCFISYFSTKENRATFFKLALFRFFLLYFFLFNVFFLYYIINFDKSTGRIQFYFESVVDLKYGFFLTANSGVDGISLFLLLLNNFIIPLCLLYNWNSLSNKNIWCFFWLHTFLVVVFTSTDLVVFFIFFEAVLNPMFLLIGLWGSRSRKIKASFYFFIYTLIGSIFMLFAIIDIYFQTGSTSIFVVKNYNFDFQTEKFLWIGFYLAFSAKIPMFPFHIWLPEAHVEAPTTGSVILASLLLKLGGYGFIRVSLSLLPKASIFFSPLVYMIGIISIIYATLTTIRQIDLKKIIAYSSIVHMNLIVLGIFSMNTLALQAAIFLMLAHGVTSSALFFLIGILYDRYKTRQLKYYGGLVQTMPLYAICFCFFSFANISFPGTMSFAGEILIFCGLLQQNFIVMFLAALGIMLSAIYSIWLVNRIIFSNLKVIYIKQFSDLTINECSILLPLAFYIIIFGVYPTFILDYIYTAALLHTF